MVKSTKISLRQNVASELQTDEVVEELRDLVPELFVAGGSFEGHLPHPASLPKEKRRAAWEVARARAIGRCLKDLLEAAGLPPIEPPRLPSGSRRWPAGYVGSVSHKAASVVAVLGRRKSVDLVGIDIDDRKGVELASGLPCERPPSVSADCASAILFSAKESVFKALHPVIGERLELDDVVMRWTSEPPLLLGTAHCRGHRLGVRCSLSVPSWIVAVAIRFVESVRDHGPATQAPQQGDPGGR